jgi:hypothetical protein
MRHPNKKSNKNPSVVCADSNVQYTDINFTELHNEQLTCGRCGSKLFIPKDEDGRLKVIDRHKVVVPKHDVPPDVREYRKYLETMRGA